VPLSRRLAAIPSGRRSKWVVLGAWVLLIVVAVPYGTSFSEVRETDPSSFLPSEAASTQVAALDEALQDADLVPAVIVYQRDGGITDADRAVAAADRAEIAEVGGLVATPLPPLAESDDGEALQQVVLIDTGGEFSSLDDTVAEVRAIAASADGLTVLVTGPAASGGDFIQAFNDLDKRLLLITALVVIVILLITYRSPFLWFVPIFAVLMADLLAQAVNYVFAREDWYMISGQAGSILPILVFGAGTDYALLLIARYREELRRHEDRHEAMTEALCRTIGAIAASAGTVAIALLILLFSSLESTRGLGPTAAIGILCAFFAMVTLLPALLVIGGRWLFWPFVPHAGEVSHEVSGFWSTIGSRISKRPRPVWIVTAVLLGAVSLGALALDPSGIPARNEFRTQVDSVTGQDVINQHFDAGTGTPVIVYAPVDRRDDVLDLLGDDDGIASVGRVVVEAGTGDGGEELVRIEAVLSDPPDSDAASVTVAGIRTEAAAVDERILIGGIVARQLDVTESAARDRAVVIPLVLLVVLLILIALLRAVIAPLVLIATVVLSYLTTLGVCAALFSAVLGFTFVDENYPLFTFIFLVALGVDYNIFLMTRVREESMVLGTRRGVLRGLAVTGGVITSAGIVLAATFAVLATLPVTPLFQIGVTVAIGVLIDAFIVRTLLVPAVALDLDRRIWWPSALSRDDAAGPDADPVTNEREPQPV
jgi:RND superfamily putative drug exporter